MIAARMRKTPTRLYHVRGLRAEGLNGVVAKISLLSEKFAAAAATHVLCDSKSLLKKMHDLGLVKANKGTVLGAGSCCGVDIERFRPPTNDERTSSRASLGLSEDDIVIGFVGRLAVDKGIKELAEAAGQAYELNQNVKLVLVGAVEFEDAGALRETLEELRDAPWATLTGPVTDTRSTYWAFDFFCSPSYREGFPIAILEAQASGLAVITTKATGCLDSIEPDITGLLVNAQDSSSLQSEIQELEDNQSKRKAMGAAARERAKSEFNMPMVQARFIDYLDEIALASTSV
jgi:glycosyltransferase involved in cell wall biosynthesis